MKLLNYVKSNLEYRKKFIKYKIYINKIKICKMFHLRSIDKKCALRNLKLVNKNRTFY